MNGKKFLVVGLLSLFMISMFAGVVSAETVLDDVKDWFVGIVEFPSLVQGSQDLVAHWLLFFLVVLIVYAISKVIPFLGGDDSRWWVRAGISVIIGILSVFFLETEEILTVLQTYKTLGIALTVIVPFFIVAAVAKDLHDQDHKLMSKFVWILFLGTLMVRYLTAEGLGTFGQGAFYVVAILSLIMIIWENRVWFFLFKQKIKDTREQVGEERLMEVTAELEALAAKIKDTPTDDAGPLIQKYNRKVKRQNELGGNYKPWGSL